MDKSKILELLEIEDPELLKVEVRERDVKILYKKNEMYHALVTEDIADINEGYSFSSDELSEVEKEYLNY